MRGYTVEIWPNGAKKWQKIENVVHRHFDDLASAEEKNAEGYKFGGAKVLVLTTDEKEITFIPLDIPYRLCADHNIFTLEQMSKEAGHTVQGA